MESKWRKICSWIWSSIDFDLFFWKRSRLVSVSFLKVYIHSTYYLYLILRANSPALNGQVNSAFEKKNTFFSWNYTGGWQNTLRNPFAQLSLPWIGIQTMCYWLPDLPDTKSEFFLDIWKIMNPNRVPQPGETIWNSTKWWLNFQTVFMWVKKTW